MPVAIWNRFGPGDSGNFHDPNVTLWQRVFYDGLGQAVQQHTRTKDWTGEAGKNDIVQYTSYDALGRVVLQSAPYITDSYVFGSGSAPYSIPDPNQPRTQTEYDMLGRVARVVNPDETAAVTTTYAGRTTTVVDANGHQMRQTVDDLGRMVQVEEFTGVGVGATVYATTHYAYDTLDNLVAVTDTLDNVTTMQYDGLGRKLAMDDPDMGAWSYAYNPAGSLTEQTDARECVTTFEYDPLERLVEKSYGGATGCAQAPASYTYDEGGAAQFAEGQRTGMTYPGGEADYAYDVRGRLVNTTQVFSGTTFTTSYTYDDLDRQVSVTYPDGEVVTTDYDNAGYPLELATSLSAEKYVSSMLYNELGLPTEMVMGNGTVTQWGYKGMRGMVDRTGTIHPYYQYGTLWRTRVSDDSGKPLFDQLLNYDEVGNVTMLREAPLSVQNWPLTGTATFSDTFDTPKTGWELTSQHVLTTAGDGSTVLRTTGVASKTQALLTRSGYGLSAGEGAQLRFKVDNVNGGAHFVLAADTASDMYFGAVVNQGKLFVQYVDPLDQLDPREPKIGYRNAADLLTTVVTDTWYVLRLVVSDTQGLYVEAYKDGDEANAHNYSLWMSTGLNWQFQEWTHSGNVDMDYYREFSMAGTAWGDNLGVDFDYDSLNRLTEVTPREDAEGYTAHYEYDEIGNLTKKDGLQYWYDETNEDALPHAVTALLDGMGFPANSYFYDANGNQISREIGGVSTSARYYDAENRLTVVTDTAGSVSKVTRFFYDGDGVRIAQVTEDGTTVYVGEIYEEYHEAASPVVTTTHYYYLGNQRVAMRKGDSLIYLHNDYLGSASLTTDAAGAVVSKQRYYPYGEAYDPQGESPTDFGFTGQRLDESTGLMYYRARYYDAGLGRFVQADMIVAQPMNPQSFNRYTYVLNNPLKYIDPTGHAAGSWQEDPQTGALARSQTHLIYGTLTDLGEYVRTQPSGNDCGAYAVANATSLRIRQVEGRKVVIPGDRTGEIMSYLGYRVDGLRGDLAGVNGATPPWGIVYTFNNLGVLRDLVGLPDLGTAELKTNGTREDLMQNIQSDKITTILFAWDKADGGGAHWVNVVGYNAEEDMFYLINSQGQTNRAAAPADRVDKMLASELMQLWGQRMGMFSNGHWFEVPWDTNIMITYEPAE